MGRAAVSQRTKRALVRGHTFDRYCIERKIADGGFGITYLGRQHPFDRTVAIKEYLPHDLAVRGRDGASVEPRSAYDVAEFNAGLAAFRNEGRTLVTFEHPNIVTVHDFREANGTAYLIMQYVPGQSLKDLVAETGPLGEPTVRRILDPLLDGLERIHAEGFLHRDVKPENIIVRSDGTPVLVDFGSACGIRRKAKRKAAVALTPGYAPWEQYTADGPQGPWTDVYALGATLYFAITGLVPAEAPHRTRLDAYLPASRIVKGPYSPSLLAAIDAALANDPADRPQSIAEFRAIAESGYQPGATIVPSWRAEADADAPPANQPAGRSRPWLRACAATIVAAVLAGTAAWGWQQHQSAESHRLAALQLQRKAAADAEARSERERWERHARVLRQQIEEARAKAIRAARLRAEDARRRAEEARQQQANERRIAELRRQAAASRQTALAKRSRESRRSRLDGPLSGLGRVFGSILTIE